MMESRGSLRGLSVGLVGGMMESRASSRVVPLAFPALRSTFHPLYQDMFVLVCSILSPCQPEMGTNGTATGLYPTFLMKPETSFLISSNLASLYGGSVESILLTATMSCLTPRVYAKRACSLVCPFLEIPASNSPVPEAIIKTPQSAWEVPVIMFLMKSRCPGASMMVTWYLGVSNFQRAMSMVIPLSRSAFSLSNTQAYLKEPFPDSWDSFSNFSMVLLSMPPHW